MAYLVALDYGHGGSDSGASANGLVEKVLNRKIGYQVRDLLIYNGIQVVELADDENTYVSLQERSNKANKSGAHIVVSMHNNAGGGEGAEIIYSIVGGKGKELAEKLQTEISKHQVFRKIYTRVGANGRDYYHMIRETKAPAVIIEYGFVDNVNDVQRLKNPAFLETMAKDTVRGICNYFGVVYKEPQPKQNDEDEKPTDSDPLDGIVHRDIVDGTQVGAFDNPESIADLVVKYVSQGKKNIVIQRV
ncbi:N-acetylmuramoyl-L-alanine amidase family protein [Tepidibacillus fermentans]|uniref:N-acetylmuramoyl-L-alanine amidase n=1 Tax=Tepidibacillus fermentans TaxID=1281767 RepID=A0A4R3KKP9_9BACI|nr:N-acetylmuramoyl-L-alanine amidase [Tepidibacillus fermentans]TCS84465.1 N-acetylmuramoyl-L-alanine amidase [Tepidibacillus fermentans]